ncbi:MAG TPA: hypothetical protein VHC47_13830, partial [Mucilaginibacter sp.]|nr:hypothetical protein [Mucilaginibacter sp.]
LLKDIASSITQKANNPAHPLNDNIAQILNIYINQANGDLLRFKLLVENWYNDMMDRVSGWYKKQANRILLMIGLVLAVMFNVSTIEIIQKLSADKVAREALVKNASNYVNEYTKGFDTAQNRSATLNRTKSNQPDSNFAKVKEGIAQINKLYNESISQQNTTLGLGWGDFGYKDDSIKWAKDSVRAVAHQPRLAKSKQILIKNIGVKPVHIGFWNKIWYVIWVKESWKKLPGFLITALAISLGAPFWFDLLNKFVNLRASGKKPEDSGSGPSKTPTLNQKPLPNSFA